MPMTQTDHFKRGIELFNDGEFFEAHEVLEDLWRTQGEPERQFTQAIIQIAVGIYHLKRDNFVGASKLFKRALRRLELFIGICQGVDSERMRQVTQELLKASEAQSHGVTPPQIAIEHPPVG